LKHNFFETLILRHEKHYSRNYTATIGVSFKITGCKLFTVLFSAVQYKSGIHRLFSTTIILLQLRIKTSGAVFLHLFKRLELPHKMSFLKNKHPNSIVGAGVDIVHDRAGTTNFNTSIFNLNVSFLQVLDKKRNHIIGVGFQNGLVMRRFDLSKATFGNQFNGFRWFSINL
jgi:hypothetical protein